MTAPALRRWTAMLCALLILLFAGVQGVGTLDRMQHDLGGATAHQHGLLSSLTVEEEEAGIAAMVRSTDHGPDDPAPVHHHHNGDHGSGLPASLATAQAAPLSKSLRTAIAHVPVAAGAGIAALERPPRPGIRII